MNPIYTVIYNSTVNKLLRNTSKLFGAVLPENYKIHPSGTVKVKVEGYEPLYLKTNQTSYVTRKLFWSGSEKYEYTPIFKKLIQKVDCFFDVGSSIGYYSVLGAMVNKNLNVHAFEPAKGSMHYLAQNIELNGLEGRVVTHFLALSNIQGTIEFQEVRNPKYPEVYNLSGEHNLGTKEYLNTESVVVNTTTLDSFMREYEISKVDLIKLDTEGFENEILKHGGQTIASHKPIIICETLFNRIEGELETTMRKHGYEFYNFTDGALVKVETLVREEDDGIRDCFFVHPEKKELIAEFIS